MRDSAEGLRVASSRLGENELRFSQPWLLLPSDAAPGREWVAQLEMGGAAVARRSSVQEEAEITIANENVRTLPVTFTMADPGGGEISGTVWYARGRGPVRATYRFSGGQFEELEATWELRSFTVGPELTDPREAVPLAAGASWRYRLRLYEQDVEREVRVVSVEGEGDAARYRIEGSLLGLVGLEDFLALMVGGQGQVLPTEEWRFTPQGIDLTSLHLRQGLDAQRDAGWAMLRTPLRQGSAWSDEWEAEQFSVEATYRCAGVEEVTVPAGTFRAFRVEMRLNDLDFGTRIEATYWYAPGTGIVRQGFAAEAFEGSAELVEFRRGGE